MKYSHLGRGERCKIFQAKCQKKSLGSIAREIGRHKSTISREIVRNSDEVGYLYPHEADKLARKRRSKKGLKIDSDPGLKAFIIERLQERFSPNMIAAQWRRNNPGKKISKETIYTFVYSEEGLEKELPKLLVRAKKKRGITYKASRPGIKNAVSIHNRPQQINERQKPGDYEGDLIFNEGSMSKNILTLVDRVTRESIMIHNESKHTSVVLGNLIKFIKRTGTVIHSITFDNGTEFAGHMELSKIGIKTYFCDPGKPYQKGSIENFNGIVRRYLPFNLHANQITSLLVHEAMTKVNRLPREILGWVSASEYAQSFQYQEVSS